MGAVNDNYRTGKKCYTNGKICKYLLPEQIKEYEKLGWYKGTLRKPLTKEQKDNISKGTIKAMNTKLVHDKLSIAAKKNSNKDRFLKVRRHNWKTKTPHEEYISDFMKNLGFIYEGIIQMKEYKKLHPELKIANYYRPDFVNYDLKIVVELDGKTHNINTIDIDNKKETALLYYGFITYRFKNKEVYTDDFKNTIIEIVSKRKEVMS